MNDTPREELPNRRILQRASCDWLGMEWLLDIGFDPEGRAKEVFVEASSEAESELRFLAHDMAIVLSHLLQRGERAAELVPALSQRPPSLLALMAQAAERLETELGDHVRAMHAEIAARAEAAQEQVVP